MVPSESVLVSSCRPPYILFLYQHSFARNFRLQFSVGVVNPQFWERGGRRGSGMVPFERALASSYPSIHIIPLSSLVYQHSFARNFRMQFSVGVANPDFGERGGRRGSRMVPFERALTSEFL